MKGCVRGNIPFGRLGVALVALTWPGAMAAASPVPFTWNPSGVPAIAGAGGAFTADGIVASDYVYAKQAPGDALGVPTPPSSYST